MVKVSVIMPNRNNEKWLPKSIGSVLNQTYKNWELIVVDDHSTDRSVEVIREFMDRDNRVDCICDPDVSYPLTKNLGFEHSSGKYVVFLDSDDWLEREFLERGVENMRGVDGYASSFRVVRPNGSETSFVFDQGVYLSIDGLKLKFRFGNGNTLLKRSVIKKYGIRFLQKKRSEDIYFYRQYLAFVNEIFVDGYIGFTVNRRGSITSTTGVSGLDESLSVYRDLFNVLKGWGRNDLVKIIKSNDLIFTLLTYLDSSPRRYKIRYGIRYFPDIAKFLLTSDFYMKDWALATFVDLFVPVKWLLRRVMK